jgi:hypothetical protein
VRAYLPRLALYAEGTDSAMLSTITSIIDTFIEFKAIGMTARAVGTFLRGR